MTGPSVYVERDASGQVLRGLRLIGAHGAEERYRVPAEAPGVQGVRFAAQWLRSRLEAQEGGGGGIGLVCLDPRGAVCSWLDVPGAEDALVRAAVRQKPAGAWGDWASLPALESAGTVEALVPTSGSTLQPLGTLAGNGHSGLALRRASRPEARRSAVLGLSDLPARLLLDELDAMRIGVEQVVTFWQAMALAWDPSGERVESDDPLVSSSPVDTAVVLVEPEGRAQWSWSSQGELLAAGSALLEEGTLGENTRARSFGAGRLAVDWLAWTAQLGRSPRRVICLIDESHGSAHGAGAFGEAITGVWPGASVDLLRVDDPVLSTFVRLTERTPGGKLRRNPARAGSVASLAARPGRTHRAMYRWTALAIVLGAVALAIGGSKLRASGADARRQTEKTRTETNALILSKLGGQADPVYPMLSLQSMLDAQKQARDSLQRLRDVRPALQAIDDIAFYVGSMPGVQLSRLVVDQPTLLIELETETTEQAEVASDTLNKAMQGFVNWDRGSMRQGAGGKTRVAITGYWADGRAEPGS